MGKSGIDYDDFKNSNPATKRTFTADDNGEKFEVDITYGPYTYFIKPIPKAVEKKEYRIYMDIRDEAGVMFQKTDLKLSEPQAQAYAAALKALDEYIQHPEDHDFEEAEDYKWACRKARRAALQKEAE